MSIQILNFLVLGALDARGIHPYFPQDPVSFRQDGTCVCSPRPVLPDRVTGSVMVDLSQDGDDSPTPTTSSK